MQYYPEAKRYIGNNRKNDSMPMEDLDNEKATDIPTDEELFMRHVICGDAELFYIDACLRETFLAAEN